MILATGSMALPGNPASRGALPGKSSHHGSKREAEPPDMHSGAEPRNEALKFVRKIASDYFSFLTHSGTLIGPSEMEAGNTMTLLPSAVHCATPATAVLVGSSP